MMNETINVGSTNTTKTICHETDVPTRLSYNLTDGATADVDLVTGEIIVTTPIVAAEDSVMGIPIAHIMRQNKTSKGVTLTSHLSVEEHLEKVENEDKTISYIYTDAKGDRYGFTEVYYTLNGDARVIVEKADVTIDVDGTMHETNSGKEVFCEYVSVTGLKLSAPKFNLKGIHLLEQRSDEQKQLEEQIVSYENVLLDYVFLDKSKCDPASDDYEAQREAITGMSSITEDQVFVEEANENALLVTRSEALQYYQLLEQQASLQAGEYADVIPDVEQMQFSLLQYERQFHDLESRLKTIISANSIPNYIKSLFYSCFNKQGDYRIAISEELFVPEMNSDGTASDLPFQSDTYYYISQGTQETMRGEEVRNLFYQRNLCLYQIKELQENIENSKRNVADTIALMKSKSESNFVIVQNYFRTLENLRAQLEALNRQMPIQYLSDGNIIRGFNKLGQLVMVMDEYEQYAMFEYDEDFPERLNRIIAQDEKSVEFAYTNGIMTTITDAMGGRYVLAFEEGNLNAISYPDKEMLQIAYATAGGIDYIIGKDLIKFSISHYSTFLEKFTWISTAGTFNSTTNTSNATTPMKEITIDHLLPEENGDHIVRVYEENSIFEDQYLFYGNAERMDHMYLEGDIVIDAQSYLLETAEDGSVTKTVQYADRSCLNDSVSDFVFVAGDSETVQYDHWHTLKQKVKTTFTRANGNAKCTETTDYVYHSNLQLISTVSTVKWEKENNGVWEEQSEKTAHYIYEYNSHGKVVRTKSYVEGEEKTKGITIEETVYDEKGSVVETMTYNSLDPTSKFCTRQDVSSEGQVLVTYDESGEHKTVTSYQADGTTVREQILPNGSKFAYGFDDESRSVSISQSTSVGEENSTRKVYTCGVLTELHSGNNDVLYTYDAKRRIKKVELNGQSVVQYTYSDAPVNWHGTTCEQQIAQTPNGYRTRVHKDLGSDRIRAIEQFAPAGSSAMNTTRVTYDSYGRMTGRLHLQGTMIKEREIFDYGNADTLATYQHFTGNSVDESETYSYNYDGSLAQKTETTLDLPATSYKYAYKDTLARQLDCITLDNCIDIRPRIDSLGRYVGKSIEIFDGSTTLAKDKITYRKVGDHATNQVSSMSFKDGTFFNYTYDEMGNITTVCENGELVVRYTYDDLSRLVREDNKRLNKTVVFVYDNNGNILVRREYAFTLVNQEKLACTTEIPETFLYVYEGDQLISYDGKVCDYTPIGCTDTYLGKAMDWNQDGRLMACYTKDEQIVTYAYDSHGRRVSKTVGGVTTNFIYNKDGNLIYQSSGEDTIQFLYDHTGVMGMKINNGTYLYRKNAQGDIIAIDNGANKPMVEYIYDAWGNHEIRINVPLDSDEYTIYNELAQANPFRYRGYYFDTETGFYYLPARYYDPAIGRFLSRDDYSYLDPESINGLNLYAYCLNNPVMNFDPSGHKWYNILGWIGIGLVVVAATVLTLGTFGVAVGGAGLLGAVIHGAAVGALIGAGAGIVLGAAGGMIYDAAKGNAFGTSIWAGIQAGLGICAIAGAIIGGAYAYFSFGNFASPSKLDAHFAKHGDEFDGLYSSAKEYAKGAKYTIRHGQKITYMYNGKATTGYIRFFGSAGKANYAFVGLNGTKTATFGIRSVSSLIEQLGITLFTL